MLSYDCRKCTNVIGCAGLRNKQYYIFNKPYSKEEYEAFLRNNSIKSYKKFLELYKRANEVWLSVPHRFSLIVHSINSAGNYINESKNALNCWNLEKSENAKNIYIGGWLKDSFDESAHGASELGYECASGGGVYNSKFLNFCMSNSPLQGFHSSDMEYCYSVISSKSCFGCANMRNQEYCILNKRYTKEEYEKFVSQIKKQMQEMPYVGKNGRIYSYGEFFPIEISPFGYNETSAQDWHPVTREEALAKGYLWSDYKTDTKHQISDYEIPDNIDEVQDDVLTKILKCSTSGNPYKIISMELQFLRRMGLPLPRKSPTERHNERIHKLLPHKLFRRTCANCNVQIETPYAPNRPEIVYCESCYNQEIN
jgi:CxxC-x17-CxxC domain-containing protein